MSLLEDIKTNNVQKVREQIAKGESNQAILFTALVEASEKGYLEIVNILLDAGVNVNLETFSGTPLGQAAFQGHLEVVQRLIEAGADVNYLANIPENKTALILAVHERHFDVIKALIKAGANVNQVVRESNEFALLVAAAYGYEEIYNYLAPLTNPELKQEAEKLLSEGIRQRQREENVDPLVKKLSHTALHGDLNEVKEVLKKGVNVNGFDENGFTPIFCAICRWSLDSISKVRVLLEAGANPNLGDDDGDETPLMRARNDEICSLLIDAGADINAQRSNGVTALMIAAQQTGNLEKVKLLIKAGADINARDNTGNTVLSFAKKIEDNEIIKLLIKAGATEH